MPFTNVSHVLLWRAPPTSWLIQLNLKESSGNESHFSLQQEGQRSRATTSAAGRGTSTTGREPDVPGWPGPLRARRVQEGLQRKDEGPQS